MTAQTKKSGFSLTELIVAMSIVAALAGIGLPAVNKLQKSFESSSRVKAVVAAAMSNARAMAQAKGKYTGIRFQQTPDGDQYMTFIIQDDNVGPWIPGNLGFRAIQGRNPIRLPNQGAIMDLRPKTDYTVLHPYTTEKSLIPSVPPVMNDTDRNNYLQQQNVLLDLQTFSIIFSPAGKLVLNTLKVSYATVVFGPDLGDDVFNDAGTAMFTHDENFNPIEGLQIESSRNHFVIIDKNDFNSAPTNLRWSSYLQHLKPVYINPYTGELID